MNIILGIDPGSNITGYGILINNNNKISYLTSGSINIKNKDFFIKLKIIYSEISIIIEKFKPNCSVIEKIFVGKNMGSSLKLCHARSAIIVALMNLNIPIFEYTSTQVKKYTLHGVYSNKIYTQNFIRNIFNLSVCPNSDEADALAIAITHYNNYYKK